MMEENGIESRGYSMHSYVHSWTIHVLNQEWEAEMAMIAFECVGSHAPSREKPKHWLTQKRLILHAARCWDAVTRENMEDGRIAWVLHRLGKLYVDQGKLDTAEKMYPRALQGYEKAWDPSTHQYSITVNHLGNLYKGQGKLDAAEKMYQQALQGRRLR